MNAPLQLRLAVTMLASTLALGAVTTRPAAAAGGSFQSPAIPVQQILDPIGFVLCTPEGPGAVQKCEAFGNPPAYQVPHGRRLIIEQVSGSCGSDTLPMPALRASIVAQTKGAILEHGIIGIPQPQSGGLIPLTSTRIYADPNSSVTIGLTEVPGFEGRFCRLTFSGQLVKP